MLSAEGAWKPGVSTPVLSTKEQDYAHMAFNKLFLKYEYLEDINGILVKRNKRGDSNEVFLGVTLSTNHETIGELEYEIDKEKLNGDIVCGVPKMIENSTPFSKDLGLAVDPIVALKRTIKIAPNEKVTLNLIITASYEKEEIYENLKKYTNTENVKRALEISAAGGHNLLLIGSPGSRKNNDGKKNSINTARIKL